MARRRVVEPDTEPDAPATIAVDKAIAMAKVEKLYWVNIDGWTSPNETEPDAEYPIPNIKAHRHTLSLKVRGTSREDASDRVNRMFQSLMDATVKRWSEEAKLEAPDDPRWGENE